MKKYDYDHDHVCSMFITTMASIMMLLIVIMIVTWVILMLIVFDYHNDYQARCLRRHYHGLRSKVTTGNILLILLRSMSFWDCTHHHCHQPSASPSSLTSTNTNTLMTRRVSRDLQLCGTTRSMAKGNKIKPSSYSSSLSSQLSSSLTSYFLLGRKKWMTMTNSG